VFVVAVDGVHGAGKSTLIAACVTALRRDAGLSVVTSAANSTQPMGDLRYGLRLAGELADPLLATLLDICDVADRAAALEADDAQGVDVAIADRYLLSVRAKARLRGTSAAAEAAVAALRPPDLQIVIDLPADIAGRRSGPRSDAVWKVGLGERGSDLTFDPEAYRQYQDALRRAYIELADDGTRLLSGAEPREALVAEVSDAIKSALDSRSQGAATC
jgi:thymidylate kinase